MRRFWKILTTWKNYKKKRNGSKYSARKNHRKRKGSIMEEKHYDKKTIECVKDQKKNNIEEELPISTTVNSVLTRKSLKWNNFKQRKISSHICGGK